MKRDKGEKEGRKPQNVKKDRNLCRNLRLGGFLESGKRPSGGSDELIPEVLRQYYLDTYLNTCYTA